MPLNFRDVYVSYDGVTLIEYAYVSAAPASLISDRLVVGVKDAAIAMIINAWPWAIFTNNLTWSRSGNRISDDGSLCVRDSFCLTAYVCNFGVHTCTFSSVRTRYHTELGCSTSRLLSFIDKCYYLREQLYQKGFWAKIFRLGDDARFHLQLILSDEVELDPTAQSWLGFKFHWSYGIGLWGLCLAQRLPQWETN